MILKIKELRKSLNLNQSVFANKIGVHLQTLSRYERGEVRPSSELLKKISKEFDVNLNWLMTGEGSMLRNEIKEGRSAYNAAASVCSSIPIYNIEAAAGAGCFPDSEDVVGHIPFDKKYLREITSGGIDRLGLITVKNDSMLPTLCSGDLAMIDFTANAPKNEQVYLLRFDDVLCIKRVQIMPDDTIKITSDNKLYDPFTAKQSDVKILGKAVWFGRKMG